jgi:pimeloyl-ACP methyl ester carboxylesterase/protein-tyrosine phosphatase
VAQFNPLLTSLTSISTCLAVDLPGCGRSQFNPLSWDAYTTDALVELLETVIEEHREKDERQGVVLIGHSMGAALAARIANPPSSAQTELSKNVVGLVAICPPAGPPSESQLRLIRIFFWIPEFVFNLWRAWDGWGGPDSPSVRRFVGVEADAETKRLQYLYNHQSKTPVWRRMVWGLLPVYRNGKPVGGLPSTDIWAGLSVPVFLVGGQDDHVTGPKDVEKIAACLGEVKATPESQANQAETIPDSAAPVDANPNPSRHVPKTINDITDQDFDKHRTGQGAEECPEDPTTPYDKPTAIPSLPLHPDKTVKCTILPKPATHALLYIPASAHVLAGLIEDFLVENVTGRLSQAWQLQFLSRDGKWDVKNLEKWKKVVPVSGPIGGVFRAMKTLREVDEVHCPRVFVQKWSGTVKDVIDISHDNPVYDRQGLEEGGVHYHKFPTVSKVPPTDDEVRRFIDLVDKLRSERKQRATEEHWVDNSEHAIGVHCHYGFNRTGYFVVCYLVERCGYSVSDAIDAFAKARPNGIKHAHFRDRLHVRYSGLKK